MGVVQIMSYLKVINCIQELPRYRSYTCKQCGCDQQVYILQIHGECDQCGTRYKVRGFESFGSEIEDVIDVVLEWIGQGETLSDALKRKEQLETSE